MLLEKMTKGERVSEILKIASGTSETFFKFVVLIHVTKNYSINNQIMLIQNKILWHTFEVCR